MAKGTLHTQRHAGRLRTITSPHDLFTTRRGLHAYLLEATERDTGRRKPLVVATLRIRLEHEMVCCADRLR